MFTNQGRGNIIFSAVNEGPTMSPASEVGISALPYIGAFAGLQLARHTPFGKDAKHTVYDVMQKAIRNLSDATPMSFFNTFRLPEMMSPYLSPEAMGLNKGASLVDGTKNVRYHEIDAKYLRGDSTQKVLKQLVGAERWDATSHLRIGENFKLVTEFDAGSKTAPGRLLIQKTKEVMQGGVPTRVGTGDAFDLGSVRLGSGIYSSDTFDILENLDKQAKLNPFLQAVFQSFGISDLKYNTLFRSEQGEIPRWLPVPTVRGEAKTLSDLRVRSALPTAHLSMGIERFNRLLKATFNQIPILGSTLERAMDTKIPGLGSFSLKTEPGPFYKQFASIGLKTSKLGAAYLGLRTIDHYRRNFDFVGNVFGSALVAGGATYFLGEMNKQTGKALSRGALGKIGGALFAGQVLLPGFNEGVIEGIATTAKNVDIGMSVIGKYTGLSYYRRGLEGLAPGSTDPTTGLFLGLGVTAAAYGGVGERMLQRTAAGERTGFDRTLSKLLPESVRSRIGLMASAHQGLTLRGSARARQAETLIDILDPTKPKGQLSENFKLFNPLHDALDALPDNDPRMIRYKAALHEITKGRAAHELGARDVFKLKKFFYLNNDLFKDLYNGGKANYDDLKVTQMDATYKISQKIDSELYRHKYINNELNESLLRRIGEINSRYKDPNFVTNLLRRTEIFGAEMYHSFFGATLSGEVRDPLDPDKNVSYDKVAKSLDAKPILRRFGALALGTALLHSIATSGFFGSMQDPQEKVDEYSGKKLVEIKKGRFWEAGGTAYSGGQTSYFRASRYASLMSKAAEKSVWGDDTERFNPITKFFLKNFTYHLEEKNYYTRPYPISSAALKDVPILGEILAATIGRVIKPPKLMHQDELIRIGPDGRKQYAFKQDYGSTYQDESARQAPMSPYNITSLLGSMHYQFRELEGLTGFAKQTLQDKLTGRKYLGTENLLMAESNEMDSSIKDYWDLELGGMGFMSEPIRRLFPRERSEIESYNPIANEMPSYIPGRYKQGDPYRLIPNAYARLPGKGYEALNPDVAGYDPEDYPDIHKYKILADIAPQSRNTMQLRQKLFERRAAGVTTEHENEMLDNVTEYHQKRIAATRNHEQKNVLKVPIVSDVTSSIYSGVESLVRRAMSPAEQAVPGILGFGFRPSAKLLGETKGVIETYEYERLYGTSNAFWDKPFRDSFRPALYSAANLLGWGGKPLHIQKKEELNEHFDKLQFLKFMQLAQTAENVKDKNRYLNLAGKTRVGVNPNGDALSIYLSLPGAEKRFFDAFTKAQGKERARIKEMVPEDQVALYEAIWSKLDRGETLDLYSGSAPQVDIAYMNKKYQQLEGYFADKPMPGPDWIGWHKDVDINDIKVKYVQNLGGEIHDYDMWASQMRRASRKPYLEGSDLFMYAEPKNISANPYTNMGFNIAKGLFNTSNGLLENSRAEIIYNDDRSSEVSSLVSSALRD